MPDVSPADRIEALEAEVERLREELENQWEANHGEHCRQLRLDDTEPLPDCPLGEGCHWRRPEILGD